MMNLWPVDFSDELETSNALELLREQAKFLENQTNGAVKAMLAPIERLEAMSAMLAQFATSPILSSGASDLLRDRQDANDLFAKKEYQFEIYNDSYRFRMFILRNSLSFPIEIILDGGIAEELGMEEAQKLESNSEVEKIVERVFACRKVARIITHMLSRSKKEDE